MQNASAPNSARKLSTPSCTSLAGQLVFDHVLTAYGDNAESTYDFRLDRAFPPEMPPDISGPLDLNKIGEDVVAQMRADPNLAAQVANQLQK